MLNGLLGQVWYHFPFIRIVVRSYRARLVRFLGYSRAFLVFILIWYALKIAASDAQKLNTHRLSTDSRPYVGRQVIALFYTESLARVHILFIQLI